MNSLSCPNDGTGQSEGSVADNKSGSRLQSLTLENGNVKITVTDDLPQFLVEATNAVRVGGAAKLKELLSDATIEVAAGQLVEKDRSRTDVMFVVAMLFKHLNKMEKAKQWYEKILEYEPNALVHNEVGFIYQSMGLLSQAKFHYEKAVQANDREGQLSANLGMILMQTGQTEEGIRMLRNAVEAEPKNSQIHSSFLFYLHFLPELDQHQLFAEHKRWGQIHAPVSLARKSFANSRKIGRRLRVGYISPDFGAHPVSYFFESLLDGHDRDVVEVYGYGNVRNHSTVTQRLADKFNCYRNIRGLSDRTAIEMIEEDGVDILIDIAGHTTDNSLAVLAHKPAPIQVSCLGYLDSIGICNNSKAGQYS